MHVMRVFWYKNTVYASKVNILILKIFFKNTQIVIYVHTTVILYKCNVINVISINIYNIV